ncbi:(deoxy)nucleoside triphosphate pyrophosphohydrolase [Aquiflexum gelatinilyticum]|uniref:8-oxo-dGTP diphosphatase n=1 Tax=Aquiflexum gelatinilyticum TaxID=2961943 RepID=A0A9X2P4G5_9BACT|nr:(deoxy)nucleoside triphosphate pyrophosphohydrolase [Aquiflexum gelatinilyticum]MCR9014008.1 (deoxy)nucleoside triphosphate pyrophosphohydrolase [Aquiflexum gelatinilyticum]
MAKTIRVTCAIIHDKGKILVAQRSENMDLPLKWEFPGGKIEADESPEACLKREIKEELNLRIEVKKAFKSNFHSYAGGKEIELIPFLCGYISGHLIVKEHQQIRWIEPENLLILDWADADVPIVNDFMEWFKPNH